MRFRIEILPDAEQDIIEVARWIEKRSKSFLASIRWIRRLRRSIVSLQIRPNRCPIVPDLEVAGCAVRELLHGRRSGIYRVFFVIKSGTVHILAVRHGARSEPDFDDITFDE